MAVMLARLGTVGLLLISGAATACGGQSSSNGNNSGGAGTTAGTASEGGKSQSGSSAGGSSGAAAAGAGGETLNEACSGPATMGDASCSAAFMYYTHDADGGICRPILYGGCGGTKNLYQTLEECQAACSNEKPRSDSCEEAAECVLAGAGCCGPCDGPGLTSHDLIAYNRKDAKQVQLCGDIACGPCPEPQGEGSYKYFIADCVNGRCVVEDLRNSPLTSCEHDTDCDLRHGKDCCESCGSAVDDTISVRSDGSFEEVICSRTPTPCLACSPPRFDRVPVCLDGHCAIGDP